MSTTASMLIEIGTEELPVKALPELAQALFDGVLAGFEKRGILVERIEAKSLYTPRRLAVLLPHVATEQPEQRSESFGPYLNVALDSNGEPTPALKGFAQKNGLDVAQLERTTDAKGERFVARTVKPGASTASLLPAILADAVRTIPIPKPMRWGDHEYAFARPVHWLVLLLDGQVVDAELFGIKSNRMSRGHRFHHPKQVWIGTPGDYVEALRGAQVLVDPDERRARIRDEVEVAAQNVDGFAQVPDSLVEEVNCLVEWPRAILCGFDPDFLRVPHEALISTMESNQKFFPVLSREHRMTEHFIGIANIDSGDPSEIRKGYERVIRPRFADAQFFYDEDIKQGIASMAAGLASVTYHQKLGSYADKIARVAALAGEIALLPGAIGDAFDPPNDEQLSQGIKAKRGAQLSKADLQSRMVNEFPELQGVMGRYYAEEIGESGDVADAIDHAYMPRFAGDAIAPSKLGQVLAIAERLDTLVGGFAAGLKPTGNKDPFALRRSAQGLARTLIEGQVDIDLVHFLSRAVTSLRGNLGELAETNTIDMMEAAKRRGIEVSSAPVEFLRVSDSLVQDIFDFILDRLRSYYTDQDVPVSHFDAVAELRPASLLDFNRRLKAIGEFAELPEAPALAAANKRIRNILKKSAEAETIPESVDPALFDNDAERTLHAAVETAIADTDPLLAEKDYVGTLKRLAALRAPVDAFFDGVMVMTDDPKVRGNRLALLKRLADRFASVAEISLLATG
ncbi:MAG TPA: glycine--tRNA ligase subunit beta [Xanthomonadaceae bacterium]|nr:glycine--tRNA ligase subunit beta [Xanthomonadaceae bacterium]